MCSSPVCDWIFGLQMITFLKDGENESVGSLGPRKKVKAHIKRTMGRACKCVCVKCRLVRCGMGLPWRSHEIGCGADQGDWRWERAQMAVWPVWAPQGGSFEIHTRLGHCGGSRAGRRPPACAHTHDSFLTMKCPSGVTHSVSLFIS